MFVDRATPECFLEGHSPDDLVVVLISSYHFLGVCRQVSIDEAKQSLIQLEAHSDTTFVSLQLNVIISRFNCILTNIRDPSLPI